MLDGDAFSHCKKGCVFINIGRGDICSEQSMKIWFLNENLAFLIYLF